MIRSSVVESMRASGFDLLTPDEAAAVAKVSIITIYRAVRSGKLDGRKVGDKALRIERQALEVWLSQKYIE